MLDEHQTASRRAAVENAIASNRLEGLELDPVSIADLNRYARGEIEIADFLANAHARVDAGEFGEPVAD